jgi:integrase
MSLYKQPGSEVWWMRFTVDGVKVRKSTGEHDPKAAQRVHDQAKGTQHDAPKLKGKTWGQAVLKWAKAQTRSESDLLCLVKFGTFYKDRTLPSVTAESIETALNKFVETEGTYNRYLARICAVANLSGLKLKLTKKRNKKAKVRDWITQEQWYKLYDELPLHLKAPASFAVLTGLRQANVLGLQWRRVDLGRSMAFIEGMDTKSGNTISVPLSEEAVAVLEAVKGQHPEWCFTYRGKPFKDIKTSFMAACIRAGVGRMEDDRKGKGHYVGFTWHGLRHTWATWQAQNGTPLEVLKELGGWEDMRMLMDNYAHHVPGLKAKFVGNLGLKK